MCGALLGGGYALCAPIIFNILFPAYKSLVSYTQFMAIDIALALPLSFMGSIFVAHKMTRAMYISNSTSSIIKIGCYIVGGVYGGIGGMIAAYIISRIIGFIINVLLLQKTISQIITIASSTEFHTALRDRIDKLKT
jgi:O-antigen/teichoic acid export membrane protein